MQLSPQSSPTTLGFPRG